MEHQIKTRRMGRSSLILNKVPDGKRARKNLCEIPGGYIYARNNGRFNACAHMPFQGGCYRKCGLFYSLEDAHTFIRELKNLPPMPDDMLEKYLIMDRAELASQLNFPPIL